MPPLLAAEAIEGAVAGGAAAETAGAAGAGAAAEGAASAEGSAATETASLEGEEETAKRSSSPLDHSPRPAQRRARAVDPGPKPTQHMPTLLRWLLNGVAWILDGIKFACVNLIFLAPLIAGVGVNQIVYGKLSGIVGASLASWLAGIAGAAATALTATTEFAAAPVTAFIEGLAIVLAVAVGIVGCLILILLLLVTARFSLLSHPDIFLLFAGMVVSSMIPIADAGPTLSYPMWHITKKLHAYDAKKRAEWQKKFDAWNYEQQKEREQYIQQIQAAYVARVTEQQQADESDEIPDGAYAAA